MQNLLYTGILIKHQLINPLATEDNFTKQFKWSKYKSGDLCSKIIFINILFKRQFPCRFDLLWRLIFLFWAFFLLLCSDNILIFLTLFTCFCLVFHPLSEVFMWVLWFVPSTFLLSSSRISWIALFPPIFIVSSFFLCLHNFWRLLLRNWWGLSLHSF